MTFSDKDINQAINNGNLIVLSKSELDIRSASICLHLSDKILSINTSTSEIDIRREETYPVTTATKIDPNNGYVLLPSEFLLGATVEKIALSNSISGHLSNISGLARLGLNSILSSFVSPGFGEGVARPITLELYNASKSPIRIYPGMRICHLLLSSLLTATEEGYDLKNPGKYMFNAPQGSEFYKNTGLPLIPAMAANPRDSSIERPDDNSQ
jgi:dCTP deaminase